MPIKIASLLFLIIFFPLRSEAQLISSEIYETEEDIQEGLESGLLTFDQYLELLDMIRNKVLPTLEEADKLYFVPDISGLEISQVGAQNQDVDLGQRVGSFLETKAEETNHLLSGKAVWRFYQKFHENSEAENLFLCEVTNRKNLIGHIETAQNTNSSGTLFTTGDLEVRKRFVTFLFPRYGTKVTLGNFDKRIGLGLNIGFHSLFGYTGDPDLKSKDSFLYPSHGRYNGVFAESKFKSLYVAAFYSRNKRDRIKDQIGALDLSWAGKNANIGLCLSEGELRNVDYKNTFQDDCRSLHFDFKLQSLRFSGEFALLSNRTSGIAFDLNSSRKKYGFDFSGWRYDDDFVHPHGGGISNPDYESIYLEEIDYPYKSRQAGERGVFFKSRYNIVDKLNFYFSFNQWRERSYQPDKIRSRIGTGYEFSKDLSLVVYHQWYDQDLEDVVTDQNITTLNLFFSPSPKLDFNFISNYRKSEKKDYGDLRLRINTQISTPLDLVMWIKYNDPDFSHAADEYFSFHVQEKVRFFENCFVSAEFISKFYQDESKVDTKTARVRMEIAW